MTQPVAYSPPPTFAEVATDIYSPAEPADEPAVENPPSDNATAPPVTPPGAEKPGSTPPEVVTPTATPTPPAAPEVQKPPTAQEIAAEVQKGIDARQPAPPPTPEKEYTQQELDEMFKVWKPDANFAQRILDGGEGAVAAIVEMRDGLLQQFNTMQDHQRQILRDEIMQQLNPALEMTQKQKIAEDNKIFYDANPDLKGSDELVNVVIKVLKAEGYKAATVEEARKHLADRVRALIPKGASSGESPTTPVGGQTTTTQPSKVPAALSDGGQSGGGAGSGTSAASNPIADLWS